MLEQLSLPLPAWGQLVEVTTQLWFILHGRVGFAVRSARGHSSLPASLSVRGSACCTLSVATEQPRGKSMTSSLCLLLAFLLRAGTQAWVKTVWWTEPSSSPAFCLRRSRSESFKQDEQLLSPWNPSCGYSGDDVASVYGNQYSDAHDASGKVLIFHFCAAHSHKHGLHVKQAWEEPGEAGFSTADRDPASERTGSPPEPPQSVRLNCTMIHLCVLSLFVFPPSIFLPPSCLPPLFSASALLTGFFSSSLVSVHLL